MPARLRKFVSDLGQAFWLVPALLVLAGIATALGAIALDRRGLPDWIRDSGWLYDGGATGARTLLGAVASSTIGVAGTVFSITIAALSLAAGQMGPRLLHNFTRDRGNQITLGAFLGTFCYALMVLRSIRTAEEGAFIPQLALGIGILLAFACVGTLVYFVGHMASRINVDTVIGLVGEEVGGAIGRLTEEGPPAAPPPPEFWCGAVPLTDPRSGYLQQLDATALADWAAGHGATIRLLIRPGDHVFPGATVGFVSPATEGAEAAMRRATALGAQRTSADDLEFSIRQLVEVAVRALSPGINDPHTAMSVIDRLGASLCALVPLHLSGGVLLRDGRPVLVVPRIDYDGLTDAMFHLIRQSAAGHAAVLIRLLEVLAAVLGVERAPARMATLQRHADLLLEDAGRDIANPSDLADLRRRHAALVAMRLHGPAGLTG